MMVRMKYIGEERKKAILDFFLCPIHPTSFTYGLATVTSHCNLFLIMRRPIRCYDYAICYNVACTADETKLLLSPSAKQRLNPCSGSPPENQDLSTRLKTQPLFPSLASRPVFPSSAQVSTCVTDITALVHDASAMLVACVTDETSLWLSPSANQRLNPCFGSPAVYQDLSTRHDWPVKKDIVHLPIKRKFDTLFR